MFGDRLELTKSFMAILTGSLVFSPLTKMAVFSFSTNCGSRASNARLERAFLGLLWATRAISNGDYEVTRWDLHRAEHSHY